MFLISSMSFSLSVMTHSHLTPIIIKYIHLAVIKITVNHIFLLIC